jgi:hypothetical protein
MGERAGKRLKAGFANRNASDFIFFCLTGARIFDYLHGLPDYWSAPNRRQSSGK